MNHSGWTCTAVTHANPNQPRDERGRFAADMTEDAVSATAGAKGKHAAKEWAKKAALAAKAGDHGAAAKAHAAAAQEHIRAGDKVLEALKRTKKVEATDEDLAVMRSNYDASNIHHLAVQAHSRAAGPPVGVLKGNLVHMPENDIALSRTIHGGRKDIGLPTLQKVLSSVGLKAAGHQYQAASSIGPKGNGHSGDNSLTVRGNSKVVRDAMLKAGWKHTHVHNLPSFSGGKNHQEALGKNGMVATTVDYGYGETTVRITK